MKKLLALCMALAMALVVLAGCSSADPENPYAQEPAPQVDTASAVISQQL